MHVTPEAPGKTPAHKAGRCWLCAAPVLERGSRCMLCLRKVSPCLFTLAPEPPGTMGLFWPQFTLAAIFLATTLAGCCAALTKLSVLFAMLVLVVIGPATVRTAVLMGIGRRSGRSLSTGETVLAFIASVGAVLAPTVLVLWLTSSSALFGVAGGVLVQPYRVLGVAACVGIGWAIWPAFRR
jgi:hypothetical protein